MNWKKRYEKVESTKDLKVGVKYELRTGGVDAKPDYHATITKKTSKRIYIKFFYLSMEDTNSYDYTLQSIDKDIKQGWVFKRL